MIYSVCLHFLHPQEEKMVELNVKVSDPVFYDEKGKGWNIANLCNDICVFKNMKVI
jgi:hypothetical protein